MSFSDHKIDQFTHRISELADQPNMPADELKARFDSSPEELRTAHNAVCDDADRLEARVEGIVVETFGDTIEKEMLSDELAAELDAKAVESSVASRITAEQTARENADADLQDQIDDHTDALAEKVEVYIGTFQKPSGNDVYLPFSPQAVILMPNGTDHTCILLPNREATDGDGSRIAILVDNRINFPSSAIPAGKTHAYIAIK